MPTSFLHFRGLTTRQGINFHWNCSLNVIHRRVLWVPYLSKVFWCQLWLAVCFELFNVNGIWPKAGNFSFRPIKRWMCLNTCFTQLKLLSGTFLYLFFSLFLCKFHSLFLSPFSHLWEVNGNHQNRRQLPNYRQTNFMCAEHIRKHWNKLNSKQKSEI